MTENNLCENCGHPYPWHYNRIESDGSCSYLDSDGIRICPCKKFKPKSNPTPKGLHRMSDGIYTSWNDTQTQEGSVGSRPEDVVAGADAQTQSPIDRRIVSGNNQTAPLDTRKGKTDDEIIVDTIARHKDWIQENKIGYPLMQLSEVEKVMLEAITLTRQECDNRVIGEWDNGFKHGEQAERKSAEENSARRILELIDKTFHIDEARNYVYNWLERKGIPKEFAFKEKYWFSILEDIQESLKKSIGEGK